MAERSLKDDPLTGLDPGRHPSGVWVHPIYRELGYSDALAQVWVRGSVLHRLSNATGELFANGAGLMVLDAWRSLELQQTLYSSYRDKIAKTSDLSGRALDEEVARFVTPPSEEPPPPHSTGGAVDVTLCDTHGNRLDMGGEFDELTSRSYADHYEKDNLTDSERLWRDRRRLLNQVMVGAGFWRLPTEWWHFEYGTPSWARATGARPLFRTAVAP